MQPTLKLPVRIAFLLAFSWPPALLLGQASGSTEAILQRSYSFPSYEQAVEITDVEQYASKEAYERAVGDNRFAFVKLEYLSQGLRVVAYLYRPSVVQGKKLPAVIFNRGGAVRGDIAPELIVCFNRLAREGFVVLAPLLRQSDGGEGRDEVGGEDVQDVMNSRALAESLGFIDPNNLFMYGESRGGMMTYQAIQRGFPLRAAAVFGAFTRMHDLVAEHPELYTDIFSRPIRKTEMHALPVGSRNTWSGREARVQGGAPVMGSRATHGPSVATRLAML